jgi:homocysteine S-methyltransferase
MPFEKDKFYCLDGGFASQLSSHFKSKIDGDPLWSCRALHDDPQSVVETHVDFIKAGANIITTNTYQVSY